MNSNRIRLYSLAFSFLVVRSSSLVLCRRGAVSKVGLGWAAAAKGKKKHKQKKKEKKVNRPRGNKSTPTRPHNNTQRHTYTGRHVSHTHAHLPSACSLVRLSFPSLMLTPVLHGCCDTDSHVLFSSAPHHPHRRLQTNQLRETHIQIIHRFSISIHPLPSSRLVLPLSLSSSFYVSSSLRSGLAGAG